MKKSWKVFGCCLLIVGLLVTGCGNASSDISVVTREEGSGTRGAFIELFGVEEKDADGNKQDKTTSEAVTISSTSVMMTTVAGDENSIGYLSLGSLNDTVKPVKIDGAEATVGNIKSGSYKVSRPFHIVTKAEISDLAKDFMTFMLSAEGQAVVEAETYIKLDNSTPYTAADQKGKIVVAGSSSVTPLMEKLKEAYIALNPGAEIDIQQSDSSTGVTSAIEGTCDIGMASRELTDEELAEGVTPTVIATDGIVVIVNKENEVEDMSMDQVKSIYTGAVTVWDDM